MHGVQLMSRWFRFYDDAMYNPKVACLDDSQFRLWIELLSIASRSNGKIPSQEVLKSVLKRRLDHLSRGLKGLVKVGLIDVLDDGFIPHDWDKHQYKSDTSNDRVAKYRAKGNVDVTLRVTAPEQNRAEQIVSTPISNPILNNQNSDLSTELTDFEKSKSVVAAKPTNRFNEFWAAYPHKTGKPLAQRSYAKVASEHDAIIAGLRAYCQDKPPDRPWLNPSTFLNQRRWEDQIAPVSPRIEKRNPFIAMLETQNEQPALNTIDATAFDRLWK